MEGVILRHPLVWNGLIKREFLEKNDIEFKTDIINREDLIFHLDISNLFFFGVYTPKPTYTYRLAIPNSLSNSINKHIIFNDISIIKALINCKNKIQDSTIKNYADKELIKTVNKFFRNILRLKRYDRNFLLRRYHLEINQTKIPRNDLNVFSKLDQISPFCYSIFADIIGVIMPKKYKINS